VKLIVSGAASADIVRLREFLIANPSVAQRAIAVLDTAIQSLRSLPDRGRPSEVAGARELVVPFGQSSYVLRYAHFAETEEIVVLRIWHGRETRE
jgi:plasmid stabilization system protein ParE